MKKPAPSTISIICGYHHLHEHKFGPKHRNWIHSVFAEKASSAAEIYWGVIFSVLFQSVSVSLLGDPPLASERFY